MKYLTSVLRLRWARLAEDLRREGVEVEQVIDITVTSEGWQCTYSGTDKMHHTVGGSFQEAS